MRIILFILSVLASIATGATTYYIAASGTFSGTGTAQSPWNTQQLNNNPYFKFQPGDNILFKRGDTFYSTVQFYSSGVPGNPIHIGTYGSGEKPIITCMRDFPDWNDATKWVQIYPDVWRIKIVNLLNHTPRVWLNGQEYQRAKDSTDVNAQTRVCFRNWDFQYLYVYSIGNPATYYSNVQSASLDNSVFDVSGCSYVNIQGLDIRGGNGTTLELAVNNYVEVDSCHIGMDGTRQGIRFNKANFIKITNCILDTGEKFMQTFVVTAEGSGDGINISFGSTNVEVAYCKFYNWRHAAIVIEQFGFNDRDSLINILVHDNYTTASAIDYGRAVACYWNEARNVVIENNVFSNHRTQSQFAAPYLVFRYNTIDSTKNNVYYDGGIGWGLALGHVFFRPENMTFEYNTIKNSEQGGLLLTGELGNSGSYQNVRNNIFRSNLFINNGYSVKNYSWVEGFPTNPNYVLPNTDIMIGDNLDVEDNNTFENNVFDRSETGTHVYYGLDPLKNYAKTIAQFNTFPNISGNKIGNAIGTVINFLNRIIIRRKIKTQ